MKLFRMLIAAIGGMTFGLLFANKKGGELRKSIEGKDSSDIAKILGKEIVDSSKDASDLISKTYNDPKVKKRVNDLKKTSTKKAKEIKKNISKNIDTASKKIKKMKSKK